RWAMPPNLPAFLGYTSSSHEWVVGSIPTAPAILSAEILGSLVASSHRDAPVAVNEVMISKLQHP
ncbi:MAG: hypothetical protein WCF13_05690, partial [Stellaceae bacterium]